MRILQVFFISLILVTLSCEKIENDIPDCIHDKIRTYLKSLAICDTGADVTEYLFQNEIVYVFNPGTCGADMAADVYNESCEKLGFLGGIAGNTIINDVPFYQHAVIQRIVWED